MIIPFNYSMAYNDALCDIRTWFSSTYHTEFLKEVRIDRKAILAILDGFIENSAKFMKDKAEFDFSFISKKDKKGKVMGYKAIYRISPDDEMELRNMIGKLFLKSIIKENVAEDADVETVAKARPAGREE